MEIEVERSKSFNMMIKTEQNNGLNFPIQNICFLHITVIKKTINHKKKEIYNIFRPLLCRFFPIQIPNQANQQMVPEVQFHFRSSQHKHRRISPPRILRYDVQKSIQKNWLVEEIERNELPFFMKNKHSHRRLFTPIRRIYKVPKKWTILCPQWLIFH